MIALDGLDSFFFETEDEWSSLTGLLHAVVELNRFLRSTQIPATLVAAVRSDIFEVLPTAELNKAKAHVVHLDWSALGIGARNKLWELVGAKAAVGRPEVRELTRVYLNQPISIGPYTELAEYFLDYTRLLPRDLIALLTVAQEVHPGSSPVIQSEAREIVRRYSEEYFVGEIMNNLAGVLGPNSARKVPIFRDALRGLPTRRFTFQDVQSEVAGDLDDGETKALLRQMFETGGLGVRNSSGRDEYTDFIYRRISGGGFTLRHGFLLHNALTVAWNRPW